MPKAKSKTTLLPAVAAKEWEDTIYGVQHRAFVSTPEAANDYYKRAFGMDVKISPGARAQTTALDHSNGNMVVCYWFSPKMNWRSVAGRAVMAHEAMHGVEYTMHSRGVPLSEDTSEPRAYYLSAITRVLQQMITPRTVRKKLQGRSKR
jgi:hypothetical protein